MAEDELFRLVTNVSNHYEADIYLYSGPMDRSYDDFFIKTVNNNRKHKNSLLFLTTYGGSADAAYKIARTLQYSYDKFTIFLNSDCKSAGTLLTLGADEIIMSEFAEIGPLDVQLYKPDELGERSSGLDWIESLNSLRNQSLKLFEEHFLDLRFKSGYQLSTKLSSDIAAKLTIGLLTPIYSQIDPVQLGDIERSISIAYAYGVRLQGKSKNLKDDSLFKLVSSYPSHGFIIDFYEAKELFHNIRLPTYEESQLAQLLQPIAHENITGPTPLINCLSRKDYAPDDDTGDRQNGNLQFERGELPDDEEGKGDGEEVFS